MAASGRTRAMLRAGPVALVLLAACATDPEESGQLTVPPTLATTTTTVPSTTTITTTTVVPPEHLTSCVENAKFLAFTSDEFWAGLWSEAGMTDSGMRATCEVLGADDPESLATIHADWQALLEATDPSTTTTTTTTLPDGATGAADPSLVASCVAWVEANRLIGEPRALDLWENLGGSTSALRDVCIDIVLNNPAEAEAMRDEMEGP